MVAEGVTGEQALALRLDPMPVIEMEVALVTCQQTWLDWPAVITVGTAVKALICGTVAGTTATVMGEVTEWPSELVAVRV